MSCLFRDPKSQLTISDHECCSLNYILLPECWAPGRIARAGPLCWVGPASGERKFSWPETLGSCPEIVTFKMALLLQPGPCGEGTSTRRIMSRTLTFPVASHFTLVVVCYHGTP